MSILKRILILLYVIASAAAMGFLAGLWLQWAPMLSISEWLTSTGLHLIIVGSLLGIACIGLLIFFIWALVAPRRSSQFVVQREGGAITVSKQSIESVIRYIIIEHRGLKVVKIKLRLLGKNRPRIRAVIVIDPGTHIQLEELGVSLQAEVLLAIQKLIGEPAEKVEIHFKKSDTDRNEYSLQALREASTEQEPVQNL